MRGAWLIVALLCAAPATASYATYTATADEVREWEIAGANTTVMDAGGGIVDARTWIARSGNEEQQVWLDAGRLAVREKRFSRGTAEQGFQTVLRTWPESEAPCLLAQAPTCDAWPLQGLGSATINGTLPLPSKAILDLDDQTIEWQRLSNGRSRWQPASETQPAPVRLLEPMPWGAPDEPPHAYPLSRAYRDALELSPQAMLWVREHPAHTAVRAGADLLWLGTDVSFTWSMVLVDGGDAIRVVVDHVRGAVPAVTVSEADAIDVDPADALPSVADAFGRLETLGARGEWHGWGFDLSLGLAWVETATIDGGFIGPGSIQADRLEMDLDGRSVRYAHGHAAGPGRLAVPADEAEAPAEPLGATANKARLPVETVALGTAALGFVAWWLFVRSLGDAASHPRRQAILRAIEAQPGIHLQRLGEVVAIANGVLRHHVRVLQRESLVRTANEGGYVCCYPVHRAPDGAWALKSSLARRVLQDIADHPAASNAERSRRLACAPSTVGYHVARLRAAGLVP